MPQCRERLQLITKRQLRDYRTDGFVRFQSLVSKQTVTNLRCEILHITAAPPPDLAVSYEPTLDQASQSTQPLRLRKIRNIGRFSKLIMSFCTSSRITMLARDLLGGPIGFYGDQVLFKPAACGSAKPLHQDAAYLRVQPSEGVITCWCALDNADELNGCMHYIPGSHKHGLVSHTHLSATPHLVAGRFDDIPVAVPAMAGDCIVHNSLTLHMTPPNRSERPRWALIVHYVRLDAQFPSRSRQAVPVVPVN